MPLVWGFGTKNWPENRATFYFSLVLMKLLRYGPFGSEKPALVDAPGVVRDLSGVLSDIVPATLSPHSLQRLREIDPASLPAVEPGRIGVPYTGCNKFVGVGLNDANHAAESGLPVPAEPVLFMNATICLCGPNDAALAEVAGYCVVNDVSEREYQLENGDSMRLGIDGLGEQFQAARAWDASLLHG